jgi:hypothetical protein
MRGTLTSGIALKISVMDCERTFVVIKRQALNRKTLQSVVSLTLNKTHSFILGVMVDELGNIYKAICDGYLITTYRT